MILIKVQKYVSDRAIILEFLHPQNDARLRKVFQWDDFPLSILPEVYPGRILKCHAVSEERNVSVSNWDDIFGMFASRGSRNWKTIVSGWDYDVDPLGIGKHVLFNNTDCVVIAKHRQMVAFYDLRDIKYKDTVKPIINIK